MKIGKNDRWIVAMVTFVVGVVLTASGVTAFVKAAQSESGVSRFLLGYTLLWAGFTIWSQHANAKALSNMAGTFAKMRAQTDLNKDTAQPVSACDIAIRATPEK